MTKPILAIFFFLYSIIAAFGQQKSGIKIPNGDRYSELARGLEQGNLKINYKEFRESFIESNQFIVASKKAEKMEKLKKSMFDYMSKSNYSKVIKTTKAMLSIDYTCIIAHKVLMQTFSFIGDSVNTQKHRVIFLGLLNSILTNGDGKSCATAWRVIQVEEQNFILRHLGAKLLNQTNDTNHGICDKMEIEIKGKKSFVFFEITKIFEGYGKLKRK